MTTDEIVKALRWLAKETEFIFAAENLEGAADLIESLQAKHKQAALNYQQKCRDVVELEAQLAKYDALAADYGIDGKTMLTLAKSQIRTAQDNINLQEQLAASRRREQADVEDARQGSVCRTCHYLNNGCEPLNLDAGCHKWQWRGPQEAGKGEKG